jgi:hypothetical protein
MRPTLLAVAFLLVAPAAAQPASPKFIGSWDGTFKRGEQEMDMVLNVAPSDTGGMRAFFDVPAQNVRGMAVQGARFQGDTVVLPFGPARFEGRVDAAGNTIAGKVIGPDGSETPVQFTRASATPVMPATEAAVEDPDGLAGDFTGEIEAGGGLETIIHLRRTPDGYAASMDVPAQQAFGIASTSVTLDGRALVIDFGVGSYAGTVSEDLSSIDGTWTQGGREINLDVARTE